MKILLIGGTGYGGIELIRLLHHHPLAEVEMMYSSSQAGTDIQDIYPHLQTIVEKPLDTIQITDIKNQVDCVFFATPAGVSKSLLPQFLDHGLRCIDLSGDFRLQSSEKYEAWYKLSAPDEAYVKQAVYGLSEIYPNQIRNASLIANPGCYPTATLLGLLPLLEQQIIDPTTIIIDGKSGVSGAGRSTGLGTHYSEINENLKAYKLGVHQHIPEIEQVLTSFANEEVNVTFTTHLVPMTRGIMCTIYANLQDYKSTQELIDLYKQFYNEHPFVRVRKEGNIPATKEVYGSNFCDIGLYSDPRTGRVTIVSVIDNLVKGAAGQAVQNLNLMNGWDIRTGLLSIPVYP